MARRWCALRCSRVALHLCRACSRLGGWRSIWRAASGCAGLLAQLGSYFRIRVGSRIRRGRLPRRASPALAEYPPRFPGGSSGPRVAWYSQRFSSGAMSPLPVVWPGWVRSLAGAQLSGVAVVRRSSRALPRWASPAGAVLRSSCPLWRDWSAFLPASSLSVLVRGRRAGRPIWRLARPLCPLTLAQWLSTSPPAAPRPLSPCSPPVASVPPLAPGAPRRPSAWRLVALSLARSRSSPRLALSVARRLGGVASPGKLGGIRTNRGTGGVA